MSDDETVDDNGNPTPIAQEPEESHAGFLQLVAQVTSLGWNMVVPIVGGVLLGRYLDDRFDNEYTWTLSLLLLGVFVAFNNLYAIVVEHGGGGPLPNRNRRKKNEAGEHHAEDQ